MHTTYGLGLGVDMYEYSSHSKELIDCGRCGSRAAIVRGVHDGDARAALEPPLLGPRSRPCHVHDPQTS